MIYHNLFDEVHLIDIVDIKIIPYNIYLINPMVGQWPPSDKDKSEKPQDKQVFIISLKYNEKVKSKEREKRGSFPWSKF